MKRISTNSMNTRSGVILRGWLSIILHLLLVSWSTCDALGLFSSKFFKHTSFVPESKIANSCGFYQPYSNEIVTITMGKGDGKKKRKKKSATSSLSSAPTPTAPPPLRVVSDSNISVKRQIKWARMKKEYSGGGTAFRQNNVRRTAYRKSLGR